MQVKSKLKYDIMNFGSWGNQVKKWCKLQFYFSFWLNDVNFRVTSDKNKFKKKKRQTILMKITVAGNTTLMSKIERASTHKLVPSAVLK